VGNVSGLAFLLTMRPTGRALTAAAGPVKFGGAGLRLPCRPDHSDRSMHGSELDALAEIEEACKLRQ
jgi:hypothetical protein